MFPISEWQKLTSKTARFITDVYALHTTSISPFGFEVLDNQHVFLEQNLRRFFIYIGISEWIDSDLAYAIQVEYLGRLYASCLREFGYIFEGCNRLTTDQGPLQLRRTTSSLTFAPRVEISTEIRKCDDILDEYAKYIVWTAFALRSPKLAEVRKIRNSRTARRRLLQLHLMHLSLFGHQAGVDSTNAEIFTYLFASEDDEVDLFWILWKGRVRLENEAIVRVIREKPTVLVTGTGLHSTFGVEFFCNCNVLSSAITKIRSTYDRTHQGNDEGGGSDYTLHSGSPT
jgi:hypothetical protein